MAKRTRVKLSQNSITPDLPEHRGPAVRKLPAHHRLRSEQPVQIINHYTITINNQISDNLQLMDPVQRRHLPPIAESQPHMLSGEQEIKFPHIPTKQSSPVQSKRKQLTVSAKKMESLQPSSSKAEIKQKLTTPSPAVRSAQPQRDCKIRSNLPPENDIIVLKQNTRPAHKQVPTNALVITFEGVIGAFLRQDPPLDNQ